MKKRAAKRERIIQLIATDKGSVAFSSGSSYGYLRSSIGFVDRIEPVIGPRMAAP